MIIMQVLGPLRLQYLALQSTRKVKGRADESMLDFITGHGRPGWVLSLLSAKARWCSALRLESFLAFTLP